MQKRNETKQNVMAKQSYLLDGFLVIHIATQQYDTLSVTANFSSSILHHTMKSDAYSQMHAVSSHQ